MIRVLSVIFWILFSELIYHFLLFFASHVYKDLLENGSFFLAAGSLYAKGVLFAVKYHVFYGIPSIVNRIVGMKITPLPRCVLMIHTGGELWKYFDTGIYEFIKK